MTRYCPVSPPGDDIPNTKHAQLDKITYELKKICIEKIIVPDGPQCDTPGTRSSQVQWNLGKSATKIAFPENFARAYINCFKNEKFVHNHYLTPKYTRLELDNFGMRDLLTAREILVTGRWVPSPRRKKDTHTARRTSAPAVLPTRAAAALVAAPVEVIDVDAAASPVEVIDVDADDDSVAPVISGTALECAIQILWALPGNTLVREKPISCVVYLETDKNPVVVPLWPRRDSGEVTLEDHRIVLAAIGLEGHEDIESYDIFGWLAHTWTRDLRFNIVKNLVLIRKMGVTIGKHAHGFPLGSTFMPG